jgi:nitrile hydratase subunit beta
MQRKEITSMVLDIGQAPASVAAFLPEVVTPLGQTPQFSVGDRVRVSVRFPVGHYRVPNYVRGRLGTIEQVIEPRAVNNEEEGYGRNAGSAGFYYRVAIPLTLLWTGYAGSPKDGLRIEIFETWLERA